ncbi:MAG: hypothetical protein PHX02_00070 [Oscillospiraceae bacterium]|nr:hypothetical protein [Oscillospiraceae bacterium]
MNKLWALVRVQLMSAFGINKMIKSRDKKEKRKLIGFAILMVFVGASLLFSLIIYDFMFADMFSKAGVPELLPALMMAASSVVTFITTVYKTNGLIFGFKDFDMTMALPVRTRVVVASRLAVLYLMNVGFCLLINIPSAIVYLFFASPPATYYWFLPVLILFIPLIPMIIGTAIGSLVTAVSSKFRHANIISIVVMLAVTIAAIAFSTSVQTMIIQPETSSDAIMNVAYKMYPPARLYTKALCSSSIVSLAVFVISSLALFLVFALVLSRFYNIINTALTTSRARSNYRITTLKVSSALMALYRRELRRYFSSPLYVLNTATGMVLALILGIALLFFKPVQLEMLIEAPGFADLLVTMSPMIITVMVCMSCTTSCSISLEGTSLWIIKSLPISADTIFKSKLLVNLTITIPAAVISAVLLALALPINALQVLFLILTPIAFAVLTAEFGLLMNLLHPNFTWTTETTVIKQSLPVTITVLGGMAVSILLLVGLVKIPSSLQTIGLVVITLAAFTADVILYRLLKIKGTQLFKTL